MTIYVVAHGSHLEDDTTFVPNKVGLYFYTPRDLSAIRALNLAKLGLQTFADACNRDSDVTLYAENGEIPNYTLGPLDTHDIVVAYSVIADQQASWLRFIEKPTKFCTQISSDERAACRNGVHKCEGLLAKVPPGIDVHIISCRNEESGFNPEQVSGGDLALLEPILSLINELEAYIESDSVTSHRYNGEAAKFIDEKLAEDNHNQGVVALASYSNKIRTWLEERSIWTVNEKFRDAYFLTQDPESLQRIIAGGWAIGWISESAWSLALARVEHYKSPETFADYYVSLDPTEQAAIREDPYFLDRLPELEKLSEVAAPAPPEDTDTY